MIYIDFHREFHASYFPRVTKPPLPWVDRPLSHHESKQYLELLWAVQQWSPENRQITELGFQNWFIQSGRVQVWFMNSLNLNLAVDIYDTSSINSAVLSSGPLFVRFSVVQRAGSPEWSAGSLTRPRSFGRRFLSSMAGFPSMVNSWLGMSLYTNY